MKNSISTEQLHNFVVHDFDHSFEDQEVTFTLTGDISGVEHDVYCSAKCDSLIENMEYVEDGDYENAYYRDCEYLVFINKNINFECDTLDITSIILSEEQEVIITDYLSEYVEMV